MKVYVVIVDYGVQNDFGVAGVFKNEADAIKFIEDETMIKRESWTEDNGTIYDEDSLMIYEEQGLR